MVFLVKTENWLHLYSALDEGALIDRLGTYNPIFEILHSCDGTQKIINMIKQKVSHTDGWIKCNPKNVEKIIELMDSNATEQLKETEEFVIKRFNFLSKKLKKYIPIWLESAYNFDNWNSSQNLGTGFYDILPRLNVLKTKQPDIYKKALEIEMYITNFKKAMDCKRYLDSCENLEILPDTFVTIKNHVKEENISVLQNITINNKNFSEIRLLSQLDFQHL